MAAANRSCRTPICDWPGLARVFLLERRTIHKKTGEVREERVYGVTSLPAARASEDLVLGYARGHRTIENRIYGPRQITDIYLLALAVRRDGRLVTFDDGIPLVAVRGAGVENLVAI